MKKRTRFLAALTCMLLLTGCKNAGEGVTKTTVSLDDKGGVSHVIVESFDKDYYNIEEMEQSMDTAIESYNAKASKDAVKLESLETIADGKSVKAVMSYKSAADYAALNERIFFVGSVSQAIDAGYELVDAVKTDGTSVDLSTVSQDLQIVVTQEAFDLKVPGSVMYTSKDAIVSGETVTLPEQEALAFVIYQ